MSARRRRPRATALLLLVAAAFAALSAVSLWFLAAVPIAMVAAFGAWLGLSNSELLDALDDGSEGIDPGRGPAGWTP